MYKEQNIIKMSSWSSSSVGESISLNVRNQWFGLIIFFIVFHKNNLSFYVAKLWLWFCKIANA